MKKNISPAALVFILAFGLIFISCNAGTNGRYSDVNLSGTINISYKGQPVPSLGIYLYDEDWDFVEYVSLSSPGPNTPWSVKVEPFSSPTDIYFGVDGYDDGDELLFNLEDIGIVKTVYDENIGNIVINLGNLEPVILSGTINVTYNGLPVPFVGIDIYDEDWTVSRYILLDSPGPDTPWTIEMGIFSSPTDIYFGVEGYDDDDELLFNLEDIGLVKTVYDTDIDGIEIEIHETD